MTYIVSLRDVKDREKQKPRQGRPVETRQVGVALCHNMGVSAETACKATDTSLSRIYFEFYIFD